MASWLVLKNWVLVWEMGPLSSLPMAGVVSFPLLIQMMEVVCQTKGVGSVVWEVGQSWCCLLSSYLALATCPQHIRWDHRGCGAWELDQVAAELWTAGW